MKLVPNDPTEEMAWKGIGELDCRTLEVEERVANTKAIYKAMLAAAPPAPKGLAGMLEELPLKYVTSFKKESVAWHCNIVNSIRGIIIAKGAGPTPTAALEAAIREVENG